MWRAARNPCARRSGGPSRARSLLRTTSCEYLSRSRPSALLRLPLAGGLARGDVEAVPDVDVGDREHQAGECHLVVVSGRFLPYLVGHGIGPIVEPSDGFGER